MLGSDALAVPQTVLVVVDGRPDSMNAGEAFLRALASRVGDWRVPRFSPVRDAVGRTLPTEWVGGVLRTRRRVRERPPGRLPNWLGQLWSLGANTYARLWADRRAAAVAASMVRETHADAVWIVLNSPGVIWLADTLLRRGVDVPVMVTVWDPPERFAHALRMDPRSTRSMLRAFERVVRRCASLGVASEEMRDEYSRRYGRDGVVQILGYASSSGASVRQAPSVGGTLTIGVAGNVYASDAWSSLWAALDASEWDVAGRHVVLRMIGPRAQIPSDVPCHVEYFGWRDAGSALELLEGCDLGYIPYWFDPTMAASVRLCFPNKAALYAAAGLPLFVHGPSESSIARFVRRTGAGVVCDTLSPSSVVTALAAFVNDESKYAGAAAASRQAGRELVSDEVFIEAFRELVKVALASPLGEGVLSRG